MAHAATTYVTDSAALQAGSRDREEQEAGDLQHEPGHEHARNAEARSDRTPLATVAPTADCFSVSFGTDVHLRARCRSRTRPRHGPCRSKSPGVALPRRLWWVRRMRRSRCVAPIRRSSGSL